ncbi:MAG: hypothetical protein KAW88_09195 [Candidatus Cloacimonetes bacterium]|nr:hypothetical protein [Candidatus Cloacimonadota bacterium]
MKKFYLILLICFLSINLLSQTAKKTGTVLPKDILYKFELIKFYMQQQELDLALTYIDSTLEESIIKDSLYYFKGLIFKEKKDWDKAADYFAESLMGCSKESLIDITTSELKNTLKKLSPMHAIEKVSFYINKITDTEKLIHFLFIIAEIYEETQLFAEANDVYKTILKEMDYENEIKLNLKIASNHIFLKEFEEALATLEPIITLNDSIYNEDALFIYYIANYSVEDFEKAKKSLLKLYLEYPNHRNRTEIIMGLSEIYEHESQYLLSWYLLNELYKMGSEAQKFIIYREISRIKKLLAQDTLTVDQFKNFKPVFEEIEENE